ncbi:hypothetical protein H4S07_004391 [Coemansia furcata]|uniref:Uncharacterized protein n=1 Tax=Coemansia furcata TaxID=417177 RepID=A0ACC1L9N1_9FUNG|nr:hypothetical protein H4S07_004391 [Coemansia furcata]
MPEIVAVIGATGFQGASVVKALNALPDQYIVRGVTRSTTSARVVELKAQYPNVEWVAADLKDPASLRAAFRGVDIVFGNTNYLQPEIFAQVDAGDLDAEYRLGQNMVDAAIAEGVKHFVYSSLESPEKIGGPKYRGAHEPEGKHRVEQYIRSNKDKIAGYFVYAGFYFQNFLLSAQWDPSVGSGKEAVVFTYPLPADVPLPYLDIEEDLGATVALALSDRSEYAGKVLAAVEGDYTPDEITQSFTRNTGVPARYQYGVIPEIDRSDINTMLRFFIEVGAYTQLDATIAKSNASRPFTTLDQFWAKYASFRPE